VRSEVRAEGEERTYRMIGRTVGCRGDAQGERGEGEEGRGGQGREGTLNGSGRPLATRREKLREGRGETGRERVCSNETKGE
jgi:hypothetical protein